jgi:glycosyltransferase involved in cell wall biosynthesis
VPPSRDWSFEGIVLKAIWIVPGFSSDENDWCIPALLDLARAMARRCDLTVVAMRYPYRRDTYSVGGARVRSIDGSNRGILGTPFIWRDTVRAVRDMEGDVLHAFWAYEPGVIAARFAGRFPVVVSLGGGELVYLPDLRYGLLGKRRTRMLMRWALRKAAAVTAGSTFMVEQARRFMSLPVLRRVPLGIDLGRWPLSPRKAGPPVILSVGSLEPVKGHAFLLRAFERVHRRHPSALVRIVGGGRAEDALQDLARSLGVREHVEFTGHVAHHELPAVYAAASMFVQASWHESQGMALLEAAACGLPIVGTHVGALMDLAPEAAVSVSVGDHEGLAAAILNLLENPEFAGRLGMTARRQVEETYSVDTAADRFLQLYRSLLQHGNAEPRLSS